MVYVSASLTPDINQGQWFHGLPVSLDPDVTRDNYFMVPFPLLPDINQGHQFDGSLSSDASYKPGTAVWWLSVL
jgi:hypothetical protein